MKRRWRPLLLALALATGVYPAAHAAQVPEPAKKDKRIRFATYDPYDVITIYTQIGMGTTILFEKGEKVVDMVGGDVEAWGADTPLARNGVFIKPAGSTPDTNLQVITNKRTYSFDLKLARRQSGKDKADGPFMTVYFRYPAADREVDRAVREDEMSRDLLKAGAPPANRHYTVQGSSDLAPVEAWDDGRSTFMRFRSRASIPSAYGNRDGDDALEQIENITVNDGLMQVPGVRRKIVLRIGREVACVFNEAYDRDAARPTTNTASPFVNRTLKGAGK